MDRKPIKQFISEHSFRMILYVITLALVELGFVGLIYGTGRFMDLHVTATAMRSFGLSEDLLFLMLLLGGVVTARFINKALEFYLSNRGLIYVESRVLDHLMHVDLEETVHRDKIELAQQVNNDAVVISDYHTAALPTLVIKLIKLGFILTVCASTSFIGMLPLIAASFLYGGVFFLAGKKYKKLHLDMLEAQKDYFGVLGGELLNVFLVKANSWYGRTVDRFERVGGNFADRSVKFLNFDFFLSNMINMLTQILTILVPLILLFRGEASPSVFFILVTLSELYFSDLSQVIELLKGVNREQVSSKRLNALLQLPVERKGDGTIEHIEKLHANEIDFSYRGSHKKILENTSHSFRTNTVTAVIGENGSGKSTLTKVIIGLLAPKKGEVKINDVPIDTLDMEEIRKNHIAFCEQEPYLLPDTILNNLNYGMTPPKPAEYYKKNPLLTFVSGLEHGFETVISAGSKNLSGGQKQKIALARTLAKEHAGIMIFDEPTSALDAESTETFRKILQNAKKGRIILIVTHDPGIKTMADEIYRIG